MRTPEIVKILLYCLAGFIGAFLLLLLGAKLTLDRAPHYQSEIKKWVFAQTGYRVGFAHVSPALRWYGPELYFDQLELRSKDDQRVLARAKEGRIAVDIRQLLRSGRWLAGRLQLDSPDIVVTRLGPNRFAIASESEGADIGAAAIGAAMPRKARCGPMTCRPARLRFVMRCSPCEAASNRAPIEFWDWQHCRAAATLVARLQRLDGQRAGIRYGCGVISICAQAMPTPTMCCSKGPRRRLA